MTVLTTEEKDQKLLDIAFEPDCNCGFDSDRETESHSEKCAWRLWRERMDRWDREDQ